MSILLEGFTLFSLAGRFLTVMVTMYDCIRVAMGLLYMFLNYLLVTEYLLEPWSWVIHLVVGLFLWYWHQRSWLGDGHYANIYALWLLVIPRVCISIGIVINWFDLEKSTRAMPLCVLGICYYPVKNCFSSASLPTLPNVELSHY